MGYSKSWKQKGVNVINVSIDTDKDIFKNIYVNIPMKNRLHLQRLGYPSD
tara:strand:+ start:13276 stop:13425 length:150 start_codon:yes stop_codon:yes gene_type:complete